MRRIAHNAWEAERDYGPGFMATKRQRKPLKVREPCEDLRIARPSCWEGRLSWLSS